MYRLLDQITSKIPFVKKIRIEFRIVLMVLLIVTLIVSTVFILLLPSRFERLTENNWCVESIVYKGVKYPPATLGLRIYGSGFCEERISWDKNKEVRLPGFNSFSPRGQWMLQNDQLIITGMDSFDSLYNGTYDMDISENRLVLISSTTKIYSRIEKVKIFHTLPEHQLPPGRRTR